MFSVYLFVSLFSSFNFDQLDQKLINRTSKNVTAAFKEASSKESSINEIARAEEITRVEEELTLDSQLEIRFSKSPSLHVGDPVLFQGIKVGSVYKVYSLSSESENTSVGIKLSSLDIPLSDKLVGLVGSYKLATSKNSNRSFIELIKVETASNNNEEHKPDFLLGFNSFQEFWSSRTSHKPIS